MGSPVPERRYDEDEVALILHRAAEAASTDAAGASGRGLTLSELKDIGAEAGIGAGRIEEAARSLALRRSGTQAGSKLGLPPTVQFERLVPVELKSEQLPHLLDLIRNEFARQGIVEEVLGGFEWRARSVMGGRYISIRREAGGTRVRVLGNYRDGLLTFAFGPGPILAILGGLAAAGLGAPVPGVAAGGLAAWACTLFPWRHLFGREKRSLQSVLAAVERHIRESQ